MVAILMLGACSFTPPIAPDEAGMKDTGAGDGGPIDDVMRDAPDDVMRDGGDMCPPDYNLDVGTGTKYKAVTTMKLWALAETDCEADGLGFSGKTHLAVFETEPERLAANTGDFPGNAWIGLTDIETEDTFIWVTNVPDPPRANPPWAGSQPDNTPDDCVMVKGGGDYDDKNCGSNLASICECDGNPAMMSRYTP